MARPKKTEQQADTTLEEQVEQNGVPFLNTDKNEGSTDNVELGESNQLELGFDEPVQLGVNAIVVEDDGSGPVQGGVWPERNYQVGTKGPQEAEVTSDDDDHPRDDIELVTNSDGTLLRAEPA